MTQKTMTIREFYNATADWADSNSDDYSHVRSLNYRQDDYLLFETPSDLFSSNVGGIGKVTDHAFNQLCDLMEVPARWARDNKTCPPELRSHVLNYKIDRAVNNRLMIRQRQYGETETIVRAILSDQYVPFDNVDLVKAVLDAVETNGLDVTVVRPEIGDNLRSYVIFNSFDFDQTRDGDSADGGGDGGLKPAVYLKNSELGGSSVGIYGGLYRSYCTNGSILGYRTNEMFTFAHRWKTPAAMATLVNSAIVSALCLSQEAAVRFIEMKQEEINRNELGDLLRSWSTRYSLPETATAAWTEAVGAVSSRSDRFTRYDVINEASFLASRTENPELRETLEVMAGDMITHAHHRTHR